MIYVEFDERYGGYLMNTQPTKEERLMAAISHAAAVISGPGILVGVVIWLTQREKSQYAARQGMQAAVYQLLGFFGTVILWFLWGFFYFLTFIPIIVNPDQYQDAPPPIFWVGMGSMVIPFAFMVIWALYGLWGAIRCMQGQDFNYVFIGKHLKVSPK
jgi:uncharacterized Tic20 family protein